MFGWVGFSFHTRRRRRQAGGAQHCGRLHNIFFSLPGWGLSFWRWRRGGWFLKQEREDRYKNAQKHKIKRGERGYRTQKGGNNVHELFFGTFQHVFCVEPSLSSQKPVADSSWEMSCTVYSQKEGRVKCYSVVFSLFFLEIWKMFFTWVGKTFFVVGGGFAYTLGSRSIIYTCFFQGG